MKIVIASGAYPPMVGGSAHYTYNLEKTFQELGHSVSVLSFKLEHKLPIGIRHFWFFLRALFVFPLADFILILDTFSAGVPATAAANLLGKKSILRIGGDSLWEQYLERTGNELPLSEFYTKNPNLSYKEKVVKNRLNKILEKNTALIFNTFWQKDIFTKAYNLNRSQVFIVENVLKPKELQPPSKNKLFFTAARDIKLKNLSRLKAAFAKAQDKYPEIKLVAGQMPYEKMLDYIKSCYTVVLPSVSDISPDLIAKAVQYGKPFIVTKYTGLAEDILTLGLTINPLSEEDIQQKIELLCTEEKYQELVVKNKSYNKQRTWKDIAKEILEIYQKL